MHRRPRHISALLSTLQFQNPRPELLRTLDTHQWQELLKYSDRAHLTLIFGRTFRDYLPRAVQARIDQNHADNALRRDSIQTAYKEAADALASCGVPHLVLKGFSHCPDFVPDLRLRMQSDLDLYCPDGLHFRARDALRRLGYQDGVISERNFSDHVPPLIRPRGWKWKGNAFDPDMPPSVELHYRFWNSSYIGIKGLADENVWARRVERTIGPIRFTALHSVDSFTYAALHALRHLLFGGVLPFHIYELGFFLEHNRDNEALWRAWLSWHDDAARCAAAVPCLLAAQWFGCRLPSAVEAEIGRLPDGVRRWCATLADSPLTGLFQTNKDTLWLHLALVNSKRQKRSILVRQLFPFWVPPLSSQWVQQQAGLGSSEDKARIRRIFAYLYWFADRICVHLRLLPLTLWHGLRLWST